jgi:hypothetical protein
VSPASKCRGFKCRGFEMIRPVCGYDIKSKCILMGAWRLYGFDLPFYVAFQNWRFDMRIHFNPLVSSTCANHYAISTVS